MIDRRRFLVGSAVGTLAVAGLSLATSPADAAALPEPYDLLARLNAERARVGLPALTWNARLNDSALGYARLLSQTNDFGHNVLGTNLGGRIGAAGYDRWSIVGEIIAAGQSTCDQVVRDWMNSPAHRAAILDGRFREAGLGIHVGGPRGKYWVVDFGTRA